MNNRFLLIVVLLLSLNLNAKSFGIGVMLGAPTGLSAKYNMSNSKGVDFATSWKLSGNQEFYIHSNYIIKKSNFVKIKKISLNLFYGGGLKLLNKQDDAGDSELKAAIRIPIGLDYNLKSYPVEFFGELALAFEFVPSSAVGFDIGLGLRYYL